MDKQAMENAIDRVKVLYMELSRTLNVPKEGRWIPRSIDEARLVLRESWSLCDALCELIRLAEREARPGQGKSRRSSRILSASCLWALTRLSMHGTPSWCRMT